MWFLLLALMADSAVVRHVPVAAAESVAVTVQGDGPVVVLVPGLFGNAFAFRRVIPQLVEAGYRTVVVEPLGVGSSSRPRDADYSLAAQAARVGAALDTLGIREALFVSHSLGSAITFRLAVLRPALVRAIVSIEGGPTESASTPGFRFVMRFAGLIRTFGGPGMLRGELQKNLRAASGDPSWVTDEVIDGYTAVAARQFPATVDAFKGIADAREPWSLGQRLAEVGAPVRLLLGGARHKSAPPEAELRQLAAALADYRAITVPGAGHFIFEERPEAVTDAVRELLPPRVAAR